MLGKFNEQKEMGEVGASRIPKIQSYESEKGKT